MRRLSGGNQQRVNIAIGLLSEPAVLLLDEPSASLDPRQRERLWEFISQLAGRGTTVVFSTHNVAEVERYARRVLLLADGELLFPALRPSSSKRLAAIRVTLRRRWSASCISAAIDPMRWLFIEALQILKRSPLLVGSLIVYPIAIALMIGFALSSPPASRRSPSWTRFPRARARSTSAASRSTWPATPQSCCSRSSRSASTPRPRRWPRFATARRWTR